MINLVKKEKYPVKKVNKKIEKTINLTFVVTINIV
jgi:hypothetical protein